MQKVLMSGSVAVLVLSLAMVMLLASCAKPPHEIEPAAVDPQPLRSMSCEDLEKLGAQIEAELRDASEKQQSAADKDAQGVFWFGVPIASAGGDDIEEEVAQLKGKKIAIRMVHDEQCGPDAATSGEAKSNESESEPAAPAASEGGGEGALRRPMEPPRVIRKVEVADSTRSWDAPRWLPPSYRPRSI